METYIIKLIVCSTMMLGVYFLILEKHKTLHFNRFYLIAALVFSIVVPLVNIPYGVQIISATEAASEFIAVNGSAITPQAKFYDAEKLIYLCYSVVTLFLLIRFFRSLYIIRKQIFKGEKRNLENFSLILLNDRVTPHSFLNNIFLNRQDYEADKIDYQIIRHEAVHVRQKHSIDLIFTQLALVFFWFNPAFYFYRKAILTNHEFLADDAVLNQGISVKEYQNLLFKNLAANNSPLTNSFNINNTKKRFKMMNTPQKQFDSWISLSTLPIAGLLFFAFADKIPAQIIQNKTEVNALPKAVITGEKTAIRTKTASSLPSPAVQIQTPAKEQIVSEHPQPSTDTIRPKKVKANEATVNVAEIQTVNNAEALKMEQETEVIPAEYPGGLEMLRRAIGENFNFSKMKGKKGNFGGTVWITVPASYPYPDLFFDFKDNDMMNAVQDAVSKAMTEKWKPATKDGKPVDYTLKLPITMNFQ